MQIGPETRHRDADIQRYSSEHPDQTSAPSLCPDFFQGLTDLIDLIAFFLQNVRKEVSTGCLCAAHACLCIDTKWRWW